MKDDPLKAPDSESWLELDEQERIDLIENWHLDAGIDLPNVLAHSAVHAIVENQAALKEPAVVDTLNRLMRQGLDRHESVHAVANVLAKHLNIALRKKKPASNEAYFKALRKLSAKKWLSGRF